MLLPPEVTEHVTENVLHPKMFIVSLNGGESALVNVFLNPHTVQSSPYASVTDVVQSYREAYPGVRKVDVCVFLNGGGSLSHDHLAVARSAGVFTVIQFVIFENESGPARFRELDLQSPHQSTTAWNVLPGVRSYTDVSQWAMLYGVCHR
jgi:hypothetical protein